MKRVLLVDAVQTKERLREIQGALHDLAWVTAVEDFQSARQLLREAPPDLLVTNLRLLAYNGIHLALLAGKSQIPCIVYAQAHDLVLARQAQAAGAFYLRQEHVPFALPAFLGPTSPSQDRRDPAVLDRRSNLRSGRRSTDLPALRTALRQTSALGSVGK